MSISSEEEFQRNLLNWEWRMDHLYYIMDKDGNKVQFVMNEVQRELFLGLHTRNVVLKARQFGITTFSCIFFLDRVLFRSNLRCGIIAQTQGDAEIFFRDKIKYAYENLPNSVRMSRPMIKDTNGELIVGHRGRSLNDSSGIRVGVSMRGGTLQYLHVSEFGKICNSDESRAREIVTGSFNTLGQNAVLIIESTAEGNSGRFYDMSISALNFLRSGKKLGVMDKKFFFFPWWKMRDYRLKEEQEMPRKMQDYFLDLRMNYGIELDIEQKNWYIATLQDQKEDMKREFPSYPEEAFEQAIEGTYYMEELLSAYDEHRIGVDIKFDSDYPVHTAWDIGFGDSTSIWFFQKIEGKFRFIYFYENNHKGMGFYINYIRGIADERGWVLGKWIGPHDIKHVEFTAGATRKEIALERYGVLFIDAPRPGLKQDAINKSRDVFHLCEFNSVDCDEGLNHLKSYRKARMGDGSWSDKPLHDEHSHCADAFTTFSLSSGQDLSGSFESEFIEECYI